MQSFYFLLILWSCFVIPLQGQNTTEIVVLFTNDYESAYDPTEAYWRPDINKIGGVAYIASLIDSIRSTHERVFLFDAGDIFTGTLSKLTQGELPFELMITMDYDAMCIGNHEFEYGWQTFAQVKSRASFPVLGANLFYKSTEIPYAQPYTIIEKKGIRLGVVGILGQDAATALIPSNIAGIEVRDPVPITRKHLNHLKNEVDLVVLLTHQGKTAPMQTNDEDPGVKRDIGADIDFTGAVGGIDILLGGHADAGTEEPFVHPETGTLIMQTYGQGFYLGYLKLMINNDTGEIDSYEGKLLPVDAEKLKPHAQIQQKLQSYRNRYPDIYEKNGRTSARINRQYNAESDLGNLFADILRSSTGSQIGMISPGAIRKDLPKGALLKRDLMDAFPFTDKVYQLQIQGSVIKEILEQSFTLERGMLQLSGMTVVYDMSKPMGSRLVSAKVGKSKLRDDRSYKVGTVEILAHGGDAFKAFKNAEIIKVMDQPFADILLEYAARSPAMAIPSRGRLIPSQK